jgi:hypothetical protein
MTCSFSSVCRSSPGWRRRYLPKRRAGTRVTAESQKNPRRQSTRKRRLYHARPARKSSGLRWCGPGEEFSRVTEALVERLEAEAVEGGQSENSMKRRPNLGDLALRESRWQPNVSSRRPLSSTTFSERPRAVLFAVFLPARYAYLKALETCVSSSRLSCGLSCAFREA